MRVLPLHVVGLGHLKPGDIVRHVAGAESYVVTANYGDRVTAVRSVDITHPNEWQVLGRVEKDGDSRACTSQVLDPPITCDLPFGHPGAHRHAEVTWFDTTYCHTEITQQKSDARIVTITDHNLRLEQRRRLAAERQRRYRLRLRNAMAAERGGER